MTRPSEDGAGKRSAPEEWHLKAPRCDARPNAGPRNCMRRMGAKEASRRADWRVALAKLSRESSS
jgi:hypothetical protein